MSMEIYNIEYENKENKLYVEPQYKSFKLELTSNSICCITMEIYNIEYDKCIQYFKTSRVKILQNRNRVDHLLFEYILALLIYCNCDKFQHKWSCAFRIISNNENKYSLIQRHSHFYYSSKYLRHLTEQFGEKCIDPKHENTIYFHGVSAIMYFTRTTTQFNAPLSTSTEINVALHFSDNIGIILALKYSFSTYPLKAKYFDCSFFSDYVNEKECLFIGGVPMLII
eukprot:486608_1